MHADARASPALRPIESAFEVALLTLAEGDEIAIALPVGAQVEGEHRVAALHEGGGRSRRSAQRG